MKKKITSIVGAVALLASVAGYVYFSEDRYAKAADLKQNYTGDRVSDLKSNIRWYQDQMVYIMSRCGKRDPKDLPEHAYKSYMDYKAQKDQADTELKSAMSK